MSIIIKGEWRMPKKCRECLLCEPYKTYNDGTENEFCIPTGKPLVEGETPQDPKGEGRFCPLAELPEKHGRLLDENDVIDAIHARLRELQTHKAFIGKHGDIDLLGVLSYIANIKAVVEADGE